ncbi:S-ribosylhomocysteine lyase [Natroniella sulfidigena]|uniref:S-ribosylhomocysteine lyase n=1 Tax=Natroniella sulfidigena TaxID=723921 RepID=UPI00200B4DFA|nr:S-ribosylhomocysteine lyase [Natroniella sulfidigena]
MDKIKVESFTLDHTKVDAPYVRKAGKITTPQGDIIQKYDLRLVQPNQGAISTGALHTLEHLLATYIREEMADVVDISPMGCRTGFYLIRIGELELEEVEAVLISALEKILEADLGDIPATTAKECGNYRDHSLFGAQEYAKVVLKDFSE